MLPRGGISGLAQSLTVSTVPPPLQATTWYPEPSADPCYGCESRFWLTGRKHHCRFVPLFLHTYIHIGLPCSDGQMKL